MNDDLLAKIKKLIGDGRYRVKIHAVKHMIEEGIAKNYRHCDGVYSTKAMVDIASKEGKRAMRKIDLSKEPCSECGGRLERKYITQEFEREGMKVKLSGIAALVCSECGETYFQPGGADKVAEAANSLLSLAIIEKQHKRSLTAEICRV